MKITGNLLGKLAQAGSLASFHGLAREAETIVDGIHALRSDNADVLLSVAINKLNMAQLDDAIHILQDQVLKVEPENATAKCFLGLALKQIGYTYQSDKILHEVIASTTDENDSDRALAQAFLKGA